MRVYSGKDHRFAVTILERNYSTEWSELVEVLAELEVPFGPLGPYSATTRPKVPKRQFAKYAGARANVLMPISQTLMNERIKDALRPLGWTREPYILDREGRPVDKQQRGDFLKSDVFVEVEFGNVASFYRDLFKFHLAGTTGAAEVAVIVVATERTARFFDQNVATYELAVQRLPHIRAAINIPLAVLGVEAPDWDEVRERYRQMKAIAEAHGDKCHEFDVVYEG
jgi:hypothetical protein